MAGQPILALVSLVLLAGGIVMQIFLILSGGVSGSPMNKVWFLSIQSKGISGKGYPGFPQVAWTYFALCPITGGQTHNCRTVHPAFPFDPPQNFGLGSNTKLVPQAFVGTDYYFLMSRFAWVFYLIALFFAVCALLTGLLALASRIGGFISSFTAAVATFFQVLAAALMTAWVVKARDHFNNFKSTSPATIGKYAMGFSWGAFAAWFLAMLFFCVSGTLGKKSDSSGEKSSFFKRNRSTRSRDGVKDEYS